MEVEADQILAWDLSECQKSSSSRKDEFLLPHKVPVKDSGQLAMVVCSQMQFYFTCQSIQIFCQGT